MSKFRIPRSVFLIDVGTVFWRDWIVLKRRLTKFILSRMAAPILYLVAFGYGLGRRKAGLILISSCPGYLHSIQ